MSGQQLIDRMFSVLNQIILLAGRDERTRAYQGVEVLRNPASATPTPAGTVQVRLEGVGQLALFFGTTPAEGDYVDVLMTETGMPIVFHNHAYGAFVFHDLLSASHPDTTAAAVQLGDLAVGEGDPVVAWTRLPVGATDGMRIVRDSALLPLQLVRWGIDYLWPWNDQIILMDADAANTEYATIALAIAASAVGDTILVPPGTWTCDNQTLPDGVNLVGLDRDLTILQTTSQAMVLTLGNGSYVYGVTIKNEWSSVVYIAGVRPPNDPGVATLHNCKVIVNNTRAVGVDPAYGTIGDASHDGTLTSIETDWETSTASAAGYSFGVYANNMNIVIRGGRIDAGTTGVGPYDLYSLVGYEIDIDGAILANHTIGGTGMVKGVLHDHLLDNLIDTAHIGDLLGDAELLLSTDFQRFEQHGTGANRANYDIGSKLERLQLGAAGENADDRGTVHYEAGRWRGRRALVIESEETNDCTNPLMRDDDADNVADGFVTWDNVAGAITWSVIDHPDKLRKGWAERIQYTGAGGDVAAAIQFRFSTAAASYAPADDCTLSYEIWGTHSGVTISIRIRAETAANALIAQVLTDITADVTNAPKRFSITYENLPALTDHVRCDVQIGAIDNGDTVDLKVAACNIEDNDYGTTPIHGNFGEGCAWAGVPHASLSTRNSTGLILDDYVSLIVDNDTQAHRVIIRMPYDYDATWPTATNNRVWDYRGASDNDRVSLKWNSTATAWDVYINGAVRLQYADVFSEGDWKEIIVTLDFANNTYHLYVDGVRGDTDTTALTAPTGIVDWAVGASYAGTTQQGGFWFAEYSVLDSVLSGWQIGNLHLANRPITDFFDNANSFTMPGTAADYRLMYVGSLSTAGGALVEAGLTQETRLTFAGLWSRSPVFFEATIYEQAVAGTGEIVLQYYDTATAGWITVPESLLIATNTLNRIRTGTPLCLPLQEFEYRIAYRTLDTRVYLYKAAILVQPGGEDNI